jgi:hypothetical protein
MQVHVNANRTVRTDQSLERWARHELTDSLSRFGGSITGVAVHLSDENSDRISKLHKRCVLEARLVKHAPVTVNHQAPNFDEALRGAAEKLQRALSHTFGKLQDRNDHDSIRRRVDPVARPLDNDTLDADGGSA